MLLVRLDGDGPLHRQTYRALRDAILGGRLRPGERLASSRELADALGVSRNTILQAYDRLIGHCAYRTGPVRPLQSTPRTKHLSTELWPRRRPSDLVAPPIGPHPANETHNDLPTSGR
ncbi:MAG: GntR family transcriptional regulator [Deltaproteobacteria bacterium]|nr:GntR family transcriptional regulator [Deltaproteobacteria bacterium]